jgi:hypothetical protein
MKLPRVCSRFCVAASAMLVFFVVLSATATAQTETVLASFTGASDGAVPNGLIADSHGNLYGTNVEGGSYTSHCAFSGCGNVFELSPNGSGGWTETVLYAFTGGSDGASPEAGLTFDAAGNLYGTTVDGGYLGNSNCGLVAAGCGVVYKLSPNGDGTWTQSVMYTFHGERDGYLPQTGVAIDASGNIFGTANLGGAHQVGDVFELSPNGAGGYTFKNIHSFTNGTDGGRPLGFAMDASGNLFASTTQGGNTTGDCASDGCGSVLELSPNGSGGWVAHAVHVFSGRMDGGVPAGISFDAHGNLFGVTFYGGHNSECQHQGEFPGCGVVFELSPQTGGGWKDQSIYFFTGESDGANPAAAPSFDSAGNVYGTSNDGVSGSGSSGAVYELSPVTGGWSESTLYTFIGGTDGAEPFFDGVIAAASGTIFGATTEAGTLSCTINGPPGCGVVYEITP